MDTNEILNNLKESGYITIADPNDNIKRLASLDNGGGSSEIEPGDGENSFVQKGSNAVAFGVNSVALGTSTTNAKERGITEESTSEEILSEWAGSEPEDDKFALVKGEGALVEGNNNLALGKNSHAEGNGTVAKNNSSHAEGTGTMAIGKYAHAEGLETVASGERSHSEGQSSEASGKTSHAEGKNTAASGENSHAEGYDSQADGKTSHAEGRGTFAEGENTHSEGQGTSAYAKNSHAEGRRDKVLVPTTYFDDRIKSAATESKMYQTLEYSTSAEQYSVGDRLWKISSDGETWTDVYDQNITVTDVYSGDSTWFKFSVKLNIGNKATRYVMILTSWSEEYPGNRGSHGDGSHTEGINTYTTNTGEHAEGTYNMSNSGSTDAETTISSIGIGTSMDDLKNAFEVMRNGDAYLYGVGGYDGTNPSGATPINQLIGQGGGSQPLMVTLTGDIEENKYYIPDGDTDSIREYFLAGKPVILYHGSIGYLSVTGIDDSVPDFTVFAGDGNRYGVLV